MLSVTPGAPLARTFSHASKTRRFRPSASVHPSVPPPKGWPPNDRGAPSLRPQGPHRYYGPVRVPRIGTLALAVFAACGSPSRGQKPWPSLSGRQVLLFHASACDELTPPIHRAPPGPHTGSSPTEFVPRPPTDPSFDAIVVSFRCVSSGSHMFVFSSHTRRYSETSTAALTTPALDRRSLRWFGISACTATPQDPPPSLASCRRSSTSSSLPFRTHMGAGNSAVVVDLPRWGPMLSPRVPNLVPIPGPRMERETPGQRPRPNYGHPQVHGMFSFFPAMPAGGDTGFPRPGVELPRPLQQAAAETQAVVRPLREDTGSPLGVPGGTSPRRRPCPRHACGATPAPRSMNS